MFCPSSHIFLPSSPVEAGSSAVFLAVKATSCHSVDLVWQPFLFRHQLIVTEQSPCWVMLPSQALNVRDLIQLVLELRQKTRIRHLVQRIIYHSGTHQSSTKPSVGRNVRLFEVWRNRRRRLEIRSGQVEEATLGRGTSSIHMGRFERFDERHAANQLHHISRGHSHGRSTGFLW